MDSLPWQTRRVGAEADEEILLEDGEPKTPCKSAKKSVAEASYNA